MMRRDFFSSLPVKVMVIFVLVSIAPLTVAGWFSLRTGQQLIMDQALNQLENVARDKGLLLERWLAERQADLAVLAESPAIRSGNPAIVADHLAALRRHYLVYRGFALIDRGGTVSFSEGEASLPPDAAGVREALAGRPSQSPVMLGRDGTESIYLLTLPVREPGGSVAAAIQATVGTHSILSIVLKVQLGETGESYLVNRDGTFLAHKDPARILRQNISRSGSFQNLTGRGHPTTSVYTDYRGIEVLGASRQIADTEWWLVVEQDRDEAFAGVARLRRFFYLLLGGFSLLAVGLSGAFAHYFAGPIGRLSEAAVALGAGSYDAPLAPLSRRDEIGTLYREFGRMAEELKSRQRNLEAYVGLQESELMVAGERIRETEEAAERVQKMAALGRLAAGVTHEIRTPLTSLKLFLQSAAEDLQPTPEMEKDYSMAMSQVARIESTINRFLNFARPQAPILTLIDVGQLFDDTLIVIGPRARHQEARVEVEIEPGLPRLRGDRKQLGEVLVNLTINALEAMKKGDCLHLSAARAGERVRIDVRDNGEGIDPASLGKLFDPFFTTKASGTGLGLSIVLSTVVSHGGEIKVDSGRGHGSTFTVLLPVAQETP